MTTHAGALTLKKTLPAHKIELKVLKNAKKNLIRDKIAFTKALQRETCTALRFHRFSWHLPSDNGPCGEIGRKIKKAWAPVGNIKKLSGRELVALAAEAAQKFDSARVWSNISLQLVNVEPYLGLEQLVHLGVSYCRAKKNVPVVLSDALMRRAHDLHKLPERLRAQALYVLAKANIRDEKLYRSIACKLLDADLKDVSLACFAFQSTNILAPPAFLTYAEKLVLRLLKHSPSKALFALPRLNEEIAEPKHIARVCAAFDVARYQAPSSWWLRCADTMKEATTEVLVAFAHTSARSNQFPKYIAHEMWSRISQCKSTLVKLAEALCSANLYHRVIHKRLEQRLFHILPLPDALDFLYLPMQIDTALSTTILDAAFNCEWTPAHRVKVSALLSVGFRPRVDICDAYTTDVKTWAARDYMDFVRAWMRIDPAKGKELLDICGMQADSLADHRDWARKNVSVLASLERAETKDLHFQLRTFSATEVVHMLRLLTRSPRTGALEKLEGSLWRRCSDKLLMQACPSAVDRLSATVWSCSSWEQNDCLVAMLPSSLRIESMYAFLPRLKLHIPVADVLPAQKPLWRRLCFDAGR